MNTPKKTRRTPQKMAIQAFLEGNESHPTAEEIHEALKPRFPAMSLSTVYNTLHSLEREGRVHELPLGSGGCRFDPRRSPHHHLVCLECRRVVDIERDFPLRLTPREARGFRALHSHIVFYGTCPDCRAKARSNTTKGD
jgi:Fur family peroxide stress response transcriptional regulator